MVMWKSNGLVETTNLLLNLFLPDYYGYMDCLEECLSSFLYLLRKYHYMPISKSDALQGFPAPRSSSSISISYSTLDPFADHRTHMPSPIICIHRRNTRDPSTYQATRCTSACRARLTSLTVRVHGPGVCGRGPLGDAEVLAGSF